MKFISKKRKKVKLGPFPYLRLKPVPTNQNGWKEP